MLKKSIIISLLILVTIHAYSQDPDPGPAFQMMMISNPALAGSTEERSLRLSYQNRLPGNSYNLHSVYFSYDSYFTQLHGGAGIYIVDDYLGGIINDLRGGISYAYFLQASPDLYINAGLSASVYNRSFNFNGAILPDQIDALGGVTVPAGEVLSMPGRSVLDLGTGFLFISGKFSGGFAIDHLTEPDLAPSGYQSYRLKRKILVHLSGDLNLSPSGNIMYRPLVYVSEQNGYFSVGAGTSFEGKSLSVNLMVMGDSGKNLNIQSGFSVSTGRLTFYYDYRFNLISGNSFMPLSLIHETGLAFRLNNFDKRNLIKTINFPKL